MSDQPTTIRAAMARLIDRFDGMALFLVILGAALFGVVVCLPIVIFLWGPK